MPFVSKAQQKACYATNGFGGKVNCAEWQKKTPKNLPNKVGSGKHQKNHRGR